MTFTFRNIGRLSKIYGKMYVTVVLYCECRIFKYKHAMVISSCQINHRNESEQHWWGNHSRKCKKWKIQKTKTKSKVWYCPLTIQCEWSWREWSPKCNGENARVSALFPPEGGDLFRKQPMTGCKFASKARLSEHALVNLSLFRHCRPLPHCLPFQFQSKTHFPTISV